MDWSGRPNFFVNTSILQNMNILKTKKELWNYTLNLHLLQNTSSLYKEIHWSLSTVVDSPHNCLSKADLQCFSCLWIKESRATILFISVFVYFFLQVNRPSPRITQIHSNASKEEDSGLFPRQQAQVSKKSLHSFFFQEKSHSRAVGHTSHHSCELAGWHTKKWGDSGSQSLSVH